MRSRQSPKNKNFNVVLGVVAFLAVLGIWYLYEYSKAQERIALMRHNLDLLKQSGEATKRLLQTQVDNVGKSSKVDTAPLELEAYDAKKRLRDSEYELEKLK